MGTELKNRRIFDAFTVVMTQCREDMERLQARMQEASDALERADLDRLLSLSNMNRTVTPKGNIRDLRGKILWVLKTRSAAMTSAQIADALYSPAMGLAMDLFRRRVIVTTSYMNRRQGSIIPCRITGKEIYWCVPDDQDEQAEAQEGFRTLWDKDTSLVKQEDRPEAVLHDGR